MTDDERYATEMLRTSMNAIHQSAAGLPDAFLSAFDTIATEVEGFTRDQGDPAAQAWHRGAVATKRILRDHSEPVKSEWLEAYADLPPMA